MGSNLWSWQRAQLTVKPRKARVVTSICSSTMSISSLALLGSKRSFGLFRFGRQPGQVERGAPNQRALISRRARLELVLFQPGQNKTVDRTARPALLFDSRQRGVARWQESPMPRTRNAERGTRNRRP